MYDLKMLEEIKSQEERIHFSSFDYNDAYTLGTMLRERGLTTPKPIAIRIVFDDIILYQSFLPGTDESKKTGGICCRWCYTPTGKWYFLPSDEAFCPVYFSGIAPYNYESSA